MKTLWTKEEVEFLKESYSEMFYNEIGKVLGRSYKSISRKAENLGLSKKTNKLWSDDEIMYMVDNYSIIPPIKIAKILGRTYNSVILKAESLGLYIDHAYHKPPYKEDFFSVWSNELAWLVGIVLSDGHVSAINNGKFVRIGMCDKDVIEKIKYITNYEGNFRMYRSNNLHWRTAYIIDICGRFVWQFFTDLGMDNHKSHNAKFPVIEDEYIMHAIRGLFDGDGSISMSKNTSYPFARICGTPSVVDFVSNYIGLHCTRHPNSVSNVTIQYTGKNALKFLDYVYKNSTSNIRMDRKYNKYLSALKLWKGANK